MPMTLQSTDGLFAVNQQMIKDVASTGILLSDHETPRLGSRFWAVASTGILLSDHETLRLGSRFWPCQAPGSIH